VRFISSTNLNILITLFNRWVGRLRTVGIQRASSQEGEATPEDGNPTPSNANTFGGSETDNEIEPTSNIGHRRVNSIASSFDGSDAGMSSPLSGSSYAGGSSVPSTPGFTSAPHVHGGFELGCVYTAQPTSPGAMGLDAMNLGGRSRCSTPRSSVLGLLDEGQGLCRLTSKKKGFDGDVKIVGMDVEVGAGTDGEENGLKMDVDS
jgi:hypothetical protein